MSNELLDTLEDLKFKPIKAGDWETVRFEKAVREGAEFLRKMDSEIIYKLNGKKYECLNCNSQVLLASVIHPIYGGSFPLSISGECHYEYVPYCPRCEKKPSSNGTPITLK